MGPLLSLSKCVSFSRHRGDEHVKDTALRQEAQSLLRRGETDSALEVIGRGLDEASARLLDENDELHEHAEMHERNLIHLHSLAAKCHHEHHDYREACSHFVAALDVAGDRGPEGFPDVFDHAFYLKMGDACHMRDLHSECVFAHQKGLELLLAKTKVAAHDEASEAKKKKKTKKKKKKAFKKTSDDDENGLSDAFRAAHSILEVGSSRTHHQMAVSLRHLCDFESALDHLGAIANPLEALLGAGDVLCEMESCFRDLGLHEEAESCLRRAASEAPAVRADNIAKVATFRREHMGGDATTCVEELERCLAMAAKSTKIEKRRSKRALRGAADASKRVEDSDGLAGGLNRRREARVRVLLGQAFDVVGQAAKAEKHLGAACAKAPEDPETWLALAAHYRSAERDDLAMPALRKAAALGEVPRETEAEAREAAERKRRKANAVKRELSMRDGNARNRENVDDALMAEIPASFASLSSSNSARIALGAHKSGRIRQNVALAAEQAEIEKQLALEAETLRLQKVKGKGSFSLRHKKAIDFVHPALRRARHVALASMAAIFESHGQTGRAMEVYASMDQSDERVVRRQTEILTEAALKLQRTFRGKKAREAFERRRKTRKARRVYGSTDGFANVVTYTQGAVVGLSATNLARHLGSGAFDRTAGGSRPLGSSFF